MVSGQWLIFLLFRCAYCSIAPLLIPSTLLRTAETTIDFANTRIYYWLL